jgi:hypothetical protein
MNELAQLPYEIHFQIMIFLNIKDVLAFLQSNKKMVSNPFLNNRNISNFFWKEFTLRDFYQDSTQNDYKESYISFFTTRKTLQKEYKALCELTEENMLADMNKW